MNDTVAPEYETLFEKNALNDFETLWNMSIPAVDAPNLERGGHSEVGLLELDSGQRFYIKRQINHLGRSFNRPGGEPTFAREFRNIKRFSRRGIPALTAAWYGERRDASGWRAILVTPELSGFEDLVAWHARWEQLDEASRLAIVAASAKLVRCLHQARWLHGSLYAKHIFLRQDDNQVWQARFIDLEKCRPMLFARREKLRDLEILMRRLPQWDTGLLRYFFTHYLNRDGNSAQVNAWLDALARRKARKQSSGRITAAPH